MTVLFLSVVLGVSKAHVLRKFVYTDLSQVTSLESSPFGIAQELRAFCSVAGDTLLDKNSTDKIAEKFVQRNILSDEILSDKVANILK